MNPAGLIIILILVVWVAIAVRTFIKRITEGGSCCGSGTKKAKKVKVSDKNEANYPYAYTLKVDGMVCSGCVRNVENAINSTGTMWARVDLENKEVKVLSKIMMSREEFVRIFNKTSYTLMDIKELY